MPSERRHAIRDSAVPAPTPFAPSPLLLPAVLACCVPALLAYNQPPSPTVFNQLAALAGWGIFVAGCGTTTQSPAGRSIRRCAPLLLALAIVFAAALWSCTAGTLPTTLGWPALALIGATAVMALAGAATEPDSRTDLSTAFFAGWLTAGVVSAAIGLLQVFAPSITADGLIASSSVPGRAVGNLRQANHLSSLLLWSAIALVPLVERLRMSLAAAAPLMVLLMIGIELTSSRTGLVGVAVLALWGVLDRGLSGRTRLLLVGAPMAYAAWATLIALLPVGDETAIGVASKLAVTDISSSRFGIWANTLALIRMHPWAGVGYGEFNVAWTLTPFPGRPIAFFDHTHNLPLQLVVELGVPLGTVVVVLLCIALWLAYRRAAQAQGADSAIARALFVMVLTMALHSQLEYPLWYVYFLLPTAWAWGICLGMTSAPAARAAAAEPAEGPGRHHPGLWWLAGAAMVLGAAFALFDYLRVVRIFAPPVDAAPLAQRIADGERSLFFGHHADYAAATTPPDPAAPPMPGRAPHYLLDARLMMAWSRAYAAAGDLTRAAYLAQRLREFNNPQAAEFFEPCDEAHEVAVPPYPCDTRPSRLSWRDFVR